jgi:hypothetical protein
MTGQPLDSLPFWAIYLLTVLVLLAAMEAGYRFTKANQRKRTAEGETGIGTMVSATLPLLGFLLAFMVGFSANLSTERRYLVIKEANAIGTAYMRAGYLDEPYRTESQDLLREYVDMRLAFLDPDKRVDAFLRSEEIHSELWRRAEQVARESPLDTTSLYIRSVNEVIDVHTERIIHGIEIRIPSTVLLGLFIVGMFTVFLVGMQSGYAEKRNYLALIVMVMILSVVFFLIIDLDRSQEGLMRVPQQALFDLQRHLNAAP